MPIAVETLKEVERLVGWVEPQPKRGPTPIVKVFPKGFVFEIPDEKADEAQDLIDAGYVKKVSPAQDKPPVKTPAT